MSEDRVCVGVGPLPEGRDRNESGEDGVRAGLSCPHPFLGSLCHGTLVCPITKTGRKTLENPPLLSEETEVGIFPSTQRSENPFTKG